MIVFPIDSAVLMTGNHLVATTTSSSGIPAAASARARQRSERPHPYASAVSNQLMPPSNAVLTMSFVTSAGRPSYTKRSKPLPSANCQVPSPIGVISMSVRPRRRFLTLSDELLISDSLQADPCLLYTSDAADDLL